MGMGGSEQTNVECKSNTNGKNYLWLENAAIYFL